MNFTDINLVAVLVAALASFVLGWLWYGPFFGKAWMKLSGVTPDPKKSMAASLVIYYIATAVMAYVLAVFMVNFIVLEMTTALNLAFWVWLGFFATSTIGIVLWENKKFNLYLLNNAYHLLSLLLMAAVLFAMV